MLLTPKAAPTSLPGTDSANSESVAGHVIVHKPKAIEFLLKKLGSQKQTQIHMCPYQNALEGELALSCLQDTTGKDWKDYKGSDPVINDAKKRILPYLVDSDLPYDYSSSPQEIERDILKSDSAVEELKSYFRQTADSDESEQ